jgi:hypothetical protein
MTNRGGGNPTLHMAYEPRFRMGPPPRSFAADAHDCIMVPILMDRPNTSLRRVARARWRAPLGIVVTANTEIAIKELRPQDRPHPNNKHAAVLATVKGKSLRDGLRPTLDRRCAQRPIKGLDRDEEIIPGGSNQEIG